MEIPKITSKALIPLLNFVFYEKQWNLSSLEA